MKTGIFPKKIEQIILVIRGQRVILDSDLASLYGVAVKRLNEQIKRNSSRFPEDFMFQLTLKEKSEVVAICDHLQKLKFSSYRPYAFTEHGAIMAANVLNSSRAVQMSLFVVRAFVKMRSALMANRELSDHLLKLEKEMRARLDAHESAIVRVLENMMSIINPPETEPDMPRKTIGFQIRDGKRHYHGIQNKNQILLKSIA